MKATKGLPIDRGWAWVVALASCGIYGIISITNRSLGIIFADIMIEYEESAMKVGWIPSIQFFALLVFSPFVGCFCNYFSCRTAALVGGVLASAGCMLSMFAESLTMLYVFFGVVLGLGFCFSLTSSTSVLPIFFDKRCALANGLTGVGAGMGGVIGPLLYRYLLDEYGLKGSFLIVGGLTANMCALGALFRNINTYEQQTETTPETNAEVPHNNQCDYQSHDKVSMIIPTPRHRSTQSVNVLAVPNANTFASTYTIDHSTSGTIPRHCSLQAVNGGRLQYAQPQEHNTFRSSSRFGQSLSVLTPASSFMGSSLMSLAAITYQTPDMLDNVSIKNNVICCCRRTIEDTDEDKPKLFEWSILKKPIFILILVAGAFVMLSGPIISVILPSHAMQHGLSRSQVALLTGLAVIPEPITRLFTGWFADLRLIPSIYIFAFSFGLSGLATFALPFLQTFPWLLAFTLSQSLMSGIMFCIHPVVLVHLFGGELLSTSFTLCLMAEGFMFLLGPPIAGLLYDNTGSWEAAIFVSATTSTVACLMLIIAGVLNKRNENIENDANGSTNTQEDDCTEGNGQIPETEAPEICEARVSVM